MPLERITAIGKYRIGRLIGQGGMGSVYLATDSVLGRTVAAKVLHSHLCSSEQMMVRFRNEARTQAKLQHPNIVTLYDFVAENDLLLIAMEYVPGGRNLQDVIRGGPIGQKEACGLLRKLLRGVAYAHSEGVIHRDLKPANVLLVDDGGGKVHPKLTDFGIAKVMHGSSLTQPGSVLGTADYMSPEQCLGRQDVDHRSDIYSLGIVFYEMLTGHVPFADDSDFGVMQKHVNVPPEPPTAFVPDLLPGVVTVCMKAIEKELDARYGSAPAMLDDLDALAAELDGLPDAPLALPAPRVTIALEPEDLESVEDDGRSQDPMTGDPTLHAGAAISPTHASGLRRPVTSSAATATGAAATIAETPPPRLPEETASAATTPPRKSRAALWLALVVVLLAAAGAAVWLRPWERKTPEEGRPPIRPETIEQAAAGDEGAIDQLIEAGRLVEALDEALRLVDAAEGVPTEADAAAIAGIVARGGGGLAPDKRIQAAEALLRFLREAKQPPEADTVGAVIAAVAAFAEARDLAGAVSLAESSVKFARDPEAAAGAFDALAAAVPLVADFDDGMAVIRLLSGIAPDSPVYAPARHALGTATEAVQTIEREAAAESLRAGRWVEALTALQHLQSDLGDARESVRQLAGKARDLREASVAGPCQPIGLARVRDPSAPSRDVGRPQITWTGKEYLAVWSDGRAAGESSTAKQVYLQRLDASGRRLLEADRLLSSPAADASRPTIDSLDNQAGASWDVQAGSRWQVVFQPLDFLGSPSGEARILASDIAGIPYSTVAAARFEGKTYWAVAWSDRIPVNPDNRAAGAREAARIVFLDQAGEIVDGPRDLLRTVNEIEASPTGRRPVRNPRTGRLPQSRLPHIAGLGDRGFAAVWEEESGTEIVVALAVFGSRGGEPVGEATVLPPDTSATAVEGRVPFVTADPDAGRIAVLWVDKRPNPIRLHYQLFSFDAEPVAASILVRGGIRYHGGILAGGRLLATWIHRARPTRLGLSICTPDGTCTVPPAETGQTTELPLVAPGGRAGLAPGAATDEFVAVWRERPGATTTSEREGDDLGGVGAEVFFVRFRCVAAPPAE